MMSAFAHEGTPLTALYLAQQYSFQTHTSTVIPAHIDLRAHERADVATLDARLKRRQVGFGFVLRRHDRIEVITVNSTPVLCAAPVCIESNLINPTASTKICRVLFKRHARCSSYGIRYRSRHHNHVASHSTHCYKQK